MTTPAPRPTVLEPAVPAPDDRLERLLASFQEDLRDFLADHGREIGELVGETEPVEIPLPRVAGKLARGGVVIVTDEGRGIARAVSADLRAMGHPVFRVRHGVSGGGVEGVNLTSSAAVAALLDRAREIGPIAAVVHLLPLRARPSSPGTNQAETRGLMLLAGAAAEDLRRAAEDGGASVIAATSHRESPRSELDGLVKSLADELKPVRVRRVEIDHEGDTEVLAADLVREVLANDPTTEIAYHRGLRIAPPGRRSLVSIEERDESQAILLGAPHRLAWIELAEALIAWINENPGAKLLDLAFTLTHDQPSYPFRVGIVARSTQELARKLQERVHKIAEPHPFAAETPRTGREWFQNLAAERFEAGLPVRTEILFAGKAPGRLDLGTSADLPAAPASFKATESSLAITESFFRSMDELIGLQTKMASGWLGSTDSSGA